VSSVTDFGSENHLYGHLLNDLGGKDLGHLVFETKHAKETVKRKKGRKRVKKRKNRKKNTDRDTIEEVHCALTGSPSLPPLQQNWIIRLT
jgi:hypothetical protein